MLAICVVSNNPRFGSYIFASVIGELLIYRVFGWGASWSGAAPLPFSACLVGSNEERSGSGAEYSHEIRNESACPK
jgi:hypothetical protein